MELSCMIRPPPPKHWQWPYLSEGYRNFYKPPINLLNLPHEIILLIIEYLDLEARIFLWNTSSKFRPALSRLDMIQNVSFTFPWRLPHSLQFNYIVTIAPQIQHLVLSHVKLQEYSINTLMTMDSLMSLDVRFTGLSLLDISRVCRDKPSLKKLAADFNLPEHDMRSRLRLCCRGFKHLEDLELRGITSYTIPVNGSDKHPYHMLFYCNSIVTLTLTDVRLNGSALNRDLTHLHNNYRRSSVQIFSLHTNAYHSEYRESFDLLSDINVNVWQMGLISYEGVASCNIQLTYKLLNEVEKLKTKQPHCSLLRGGDSIRCNPAKAMSLFMWRDHLSKKNPKMYQDIISEIWSKFPLRICKKTGVVTDVDFCLLGTCTWGSVPVHAVRSQFNRKNRIYHNEIDLNLHNILYTDRHLKISYANLKCGCESEKSCFTILKLNVPVLSNVVEFYMYDINVSHRFYQHLFAYSLHLETFHLHTKNPNIRYTTALGKLYISKTLKNFHLISGTVVDIMAVLKAVSGCPQIRNLAICNTNEPLWKIKEKLRISEPILSKLFSSCPQLVTLSIVLIKTLDVIDENEMVYEYYEEITDAISHIIRSQNLKVSFLYDNCKFEWFDKVMGTDMEFTVLFGNKKLETLKINKEIVK